MGTPRILLAACALLAAIAAGCDTGGFTVVTLRARPAVRTVDRVDVTVANQESTRSERFRLDGRPFPLTFSVETGDRAGPLTIDVTASDASGAAIASGSTTTTIVPDTRSDVELMLEPHDFPVNTIYVGDQALVFRAEAAGRQIAVSPTGIATIGWSDSCEVVAERCDVFGRRFDPTGLAVATQAAAGDGQFTINRSNNILGFEPSLATNADGVTLAVWADDNDLLAVVIDASGRASPATETIVADNTQPSTAAVAALSGGVFVVAWTETGPAPGTFLVRARYVAANGAIAPNPINSNGDAYTVSTTPVSARTPPTIAALGDAGAHAIAWRIGTAVRGRFYSGTGQARGADTLLAGYPAQDQIAEPQIARVENDVVLLYARKSAPGGDADAGQLVLRRVTVDGQRVGPDAIATREIVVRPSALTTRADGAIAVAWEACMSESDASGCAIRLQMFRPTLAAVGPPRMVNTTTMNNQIEPSLGVMPEGALIAAFSDGSGLAPDQDGFGIRARIVYPAYDDARGVLGATCAASTECGEGNVCMSGSDAAARCYRACTDGACPYGGTCTTAGSEAGCLF